MKCKKKDIKEMLPAYLEQGLDITGQKRIEEHLAFCEDCRTELSLLQMMLEEPVPDPGEAFWTTMPQRIEREVRRQNEKKSSVFSDLLSGLLIPRWALATATTGIIVAVWLLVRPVPVDIALTNLQENEAIEDAVTGEPVNLAELSSTELTAASQWAQNEFAPIREAVSEDGSDNSERDPSGDLYNMSPDELDRLYEMLKTKEQEMQNRIRKKNINQKIIG